MLKKTLLLSISITLFVITLTPSANSNTTHATPYNNPIRVYQPYTVDGDTIYIRLKEGKVKIRLSGIDCFESNNNPHIIYQIQDYGLSESEIIKKGQAATRILKNIIETNKNDIYFELTGIDKKYGRLVGVIYYKDKNGNLININEKMQKTGYCPEYIFLPKTN